MNAASTLTPFVGPISIGVVLAAAAIDIRQRRIPNWLTVGTWLLALPIQVSIHGWESGALAWACGWSVGLAVFLPFYLLRGMAAGDVKLMTALGALLGATMAFEIALATFVIGGVWALALTLRRRRAAQLFRNICCIVLTSGRAAPGMARNGQPSEGLPSVGSLPYAIAIAAGTLTMLFAST